MACCSLPAGGVTPSFTSHSRAFFTCGRPQLPSRPCHRRHVAQAVSGEAGGVEEYARREFILQAVNYAVLGDLIGTDDGRTIVNSILGAYGLPQLKSSKGFKFYDDFDSEYTFEYPTSWVSRPNSQRQGIYIADFNTADKLTVEVFAQDETAGQALQEAVVGKIVDPAKQAGGDSKLFFPSEKAVKAEEKLVDGQKYLYLSFPSTTITRSGYEVRRKNFAVAALKNGQVFCLGASARSDQFNPEKENLLRHIVDSFRLR